MKILIAFCIMTLLPFAQQDEVYHIIKVEGTIYVASTRQKLKQGDKIKPSDQLEFATADASALVISNTAGKFTLQMPESDDIFGDDQLFAMADNAKTRIDGRPQVSTRSTFNAEVSDLKVYLGEDEFTIIGDELKIKLSKSEYPIDENSYFLLRYNIEGSNVTKKPEVQEQSIIINRTNVFSNFDDDRITDVELFIVNKSTGDTQKITKFNLSFLDKAELEKEFEIIIEILKEQGSTKDQIIEYLRQYFVDIYGLTDMNTLNMFLSQITSGI